ncbi:DUF4136 domain-containing protein [Chitinibacter sp. S2-10]|uniref:DUF4136 domain-containing protein n=1 Tax=Chitinibacter sp. S2-10 TaxID=3373597 RepID=UPI0039773287
MFCRQRSCRSRSLSVLLIVLAFVLAGCTTPTFVATVSVRHQLPEIMASTPATGAAAVQAAMALPKTFTIERLPAQSQSLAFQQFETELIAHLTQQGLVWIADSKPGDSNRADWLVKLDYRVDNGVVQSYQQPVWGTIGFSIGYSHVHTSGGVILLPSYYPEFGVVGSQTYNETRYTRELWLDIFDRKTLKQGEFAKLYEGHATNQSRSGDLESAVPWLLRSLFLPFPGPSGVNREVRIPLPPAQP